MKYPVPSFGYLFLILSAGMLIGRVAEAKTISVTTNDTFAKIEGAGPGDEVVISPGIYKFRVYLSKQATPTNPVIIRALDPSNRPVWDFGSTLVENAPGSYTAGDRGRGGWQFSGAHNYSISGIVFRHCRTASFNSAGIRYYNGTTNLFIKDCIFNLNDNGLTGGTQNSQATVEFCEFDSNGNTSASSSSPTHNIYVYGGDLALRYCYVHDSVQGENFHIRCRNSTLEYNWFARAKNYEGDLMSDDDFSGAGPFTQVMTLRGNVFVQNTLPGNHSQVVALYNDSGVANLTLSLRMLYNTFVGVNTNSALVHVSNADGTKMTAEISNNIIYGTKTPVLIEDATAAVVSGVNNWLQTNATAGPLSGSIRSGSPGFRNPTAKDFTLTSESACLAAASGLVFGLPGRQYSQNEIVNRQWCVRDSAKDIGAVESTGLTTAYGPYDPTPVPSLNIVNSGNNLSFSWSLFAQDFQLCSSSTINTSNWDLMSISISTNLDGLSAVTSATASPAFFRLMRQD